MASENVLELTDDNFQSEVIEADQPVLVDFWAEWCMPCRMLAPTIDKVASQFDGKAKVGKVDTDANRDVSVKYGITAIPTILLFKDGEVVKKFVGVTGEQEFVDELSQHTGG
jgi:thioredoxin 1